MLPVQPNFRFSVTVDSIQYAAFTECTLPSLQVETLDIKEGGQNAYTHKLPVRVNPGNLTLKHGISKGDKLLAWYMQVLAGDMENAMRQVTVTLYKVDFQAMMVWNLRNAYPIKWTGPSLATKDAAIAIQTLEIVHHGFEVS